MKKILITVHELTYTGSLFSAKRICKILLTNGYSVDVWSYKEGDFAKEFISLGINPKIIDRNTVYNNEDYEKEFEKYDLVIANTIVTYELADIAKNIVPTIWYIREAQNIKWQFLDHDYKIYYALKRAENIYTVSEYAKEYITENFNENVKVVHNAVEDEWEKYSLYKTQKNDRIKLLALGTIEQRKAFDVFIDAYIALEENERSRMEVHFAGRLTDGEKNYCASVIEKTTTNEGIYYHGEIQDRGELMQLMNESDVVVVPSRDESCSLVALEAIMMAKPIVFSENVGAKYTLTKENGWLFETGDAKSLAQVYREILANPERLEGMGMASRKVYLETSTMPVYEKNILKMIQENLVPDKEAYRQEQYSKAQMEYVEREAELTKKPYTYGFSSLDVPEGAKIAIYAAGMIGKILYQYVSESNKYEAVLWVDKAYQSFGNDKVSGLDRLFDVKYDYIYIAVLEEKVACDIRVELMNLGIDGDKILWKAPEKYFDGVEK